MVTAKKTITNRTKIIKANSLHTVGLITAKMSFLLFFPARFAHVRYSSRMIDRFLNWGDHGKPKSGKIKGRCQPPLRGFYLVLPCCTFPILSFGRFNESTVFFGCKEHIVRTGTDAWLVCGLLCERFQVRFTCLTFHQEALITYINSRKTEH